MDHILEHDGEPIPELGGVSEQSAGGSAPMNVDDGDEDMEALTSLGVLKGSGAAIAAAAAPAEAKVRRSLSIPRSRQYSFLVNRASSALNAAKLSKTLLSPISTPKRAVTISLKNLLKK